MFSSLILALNCAHRFSFTWKTCPTQCHIVSSIVSEKILSIIFPGCCLAVKPGLLNLPSRDYVIKVKRVILTFPLETDK